MDELKKLLLNVVPSLCILMLMAELRVLLLKSCTNQSGQYPRQIVDLAQFETPSSQFSQMQQVTSDLLHLSLSHSLIERCPLLAFLQKGIFLQNTHISQKLFLIVAIFPNSSSLPSSPPPSSSPEPIHIL